MLLLTLLLLTASLDAEPRFVEAQSRFTALDYEGALALLDALVSEPHPDSERATLLVWTGAARALLGDESAARLAFESALRLDPTSTLGFRTSPKVTALFEDVRAHMPPPSVSAAAAPPSAPPDAPSSNTAPSDPSTATAPPAAAPPHVPQPSSSGPVWWGVAVTTGVLGLGAAGATAVLTTDALGKARIAEDPAMSQLDASKTIESANTALWIAGALGGAALAMLAAAGTTTLVALDSP